MSDNLELVNLKIAQLGQIVEQYRVDIYHEGLRAELLHKMLEEKGILIKDEFNKRWPQYLENDVGVINPATGVMSGSLKTKIYGE
jgi:hypothetical protein